MFEKVIPGTLLVGGFGEIGSRREHGQQVLVGGRHPAEVAQVPIERVALCLDLCRNRGHHKIAAVAAVPAHRESPGCVLRLRGPARESEHGQEAERQKEPKPKHAY